MQITQKAPMDYDNDIDITPLMDIVFIVLIFFIVSASYIKEQGLTISTPPQVPLTETPATTKVVLEVDAFNNIRLQDMTILASSIRPSVGRMLIENPKASVIINVHPKSSTQTMIQIIDALRSANIDSPPVNLTTI